MSDDRIPKIPSFEELGISEDEIEELERELEREAKEGAGGEDAAPLPGPGEGRANDAGDGRRGAGPVPGTAPTPDTGAPPGPSAKTAPATKSEVVPAALPWRGWRGPLTLLLLLALAWSSSSFRVPPSPAPASAPDSVFSSARAMSHLAVIASEARPTGSPAHGRVRDHLLGQLRALGHEPVVQTATSVTEYGPFARAATVRNILARIPGSRPGGEAVLVTAHYDSRGISRGAGDDGSGVVAILETLRALGTRAPLRNDLIVLLTDAEELGLLGAQAFVDEHPWMEDVALVVSIEMRGGGGPSMMFETGAGNGWVIEALRRANPRPAANSVASEVYRRMPNDTDFTLFKEAGKQGLNFAGVARAHLYHQVYDSPENFSEATLQHQGVQVMAMLRHFGDADLGAVDAPDVSYVSLPIVGLVTYGAPWIWALGVACAGLWTGVLLVGRRRGSRLPGVLVGFLASAVQLGAAAAAGFYLYDWRRGAHPETGALHAGAFHSEGWYVLAIVSAAFLFTILSLALLRRWFTLAELSVGALFAPVALAAVSAVMFPMAAVNFQLPALAGCLGALAVVGAPRSGPVAFWRWVVALLAAVPVVAVLTPLTEGVWLAMGMSLAPALALLAGLVFILALPLLDTLREPNGWWAPLTGGVALGAFLAVGVSTATPSARRPAPSTLVYLMDREAGTAHWGTEDGRDPSDPGVAWAEAVAGPFAGGADPETFRYFGMGGVQYALAVADPLEAPPPAVAVVKDSTLADTLVRLAVTSEIGAEMIVVRFDRTGPRIVALNGRPFSGERIPSIIEHWGTPEEGLILDVVHRPSDPPLAFTIVEHHLRPAELLGGARFSRPSHLAPNVRMLSDRAMIRTRVSVQVPASAEGQ